MGRLLLENGAPLSARSKHGFTALHLSVLNNKPAFVELLIGYGATIDVKGGPLMETPLHLACRQGRDPECAKMLLLSGADVNVTGKETGESPLHIVARRSYLKLMSLLLEEGADINLLSCAGETALHVAVRHSHIEAVRLLINSAPDPVSAESLVNTANNEGETALHLACELCSPDALPIVHILLNNGANLLTTTKLTGENPLHYAARCNSVETMREFGRFIAGDYHSIANRQCKNGWSPLLTAANYGHEYVVELLLYKEVRADVFDEHGLGALHLAAAKGFSRCCELLLGRKAFVNAKSKLGITPLHLATENGFSKLADILITNYGASVDAMTLTKKTPLHLASESGHLDCVKVLVSKKANVKARDSLVGLPIHLAAKHNHHEVVKYFLGAYPELAFLPTNLEGMLCSHLAAASGSMAVIRELMRFNKAVVIGLRSRGSASLPIHMAARKGNANVVRLLITAGASVTHENNFGMSMIHAAAMNGHLNVLEVVRSRKISCNVISKKNGLSPLHLAAFMGCYDVVRDLLADIPPDIRSKKILHRHLRDEKLEQIVAIDVSFRKKLIEISKKRKQYFKRGFTPLHFAAFAGQDTVVRLLLNTHSVDVEAVSVDSETTAMHLAAITGQMTICSLISAKSPHLLKARDRNGTTPLMLAAQNGHCEMVTNFVGQGANVNSSDHAGWTPLHFAARSGRIDVMSLLIELGASCSQVTKNGKSPLSLAAASGHNDAFFFLLKRNFDAELLLVDDEFLYDLMLLGRQNKQQTIEEFALVSQSPMSIAATLTKRYSEMAENNKQHSKELIATSRFCEKITVTLMDLAVSQASASAILQAIDAKGRQMIDGKLMNPLGLI